jgi:hypothetical protein
MTTELTERQMNQVLPTFPSDADIQDIVEALRSEKYHAIITKLSGPTAVVLSRLRREYYSPQNGDFIQNIFPNEEGITLAHLLGQVPDKEVSCDPMMVILASKLRMTREQLIDIFLPDPENRNPAVPPPLDMWCFIPENDAKARRWVDNLNIALRTHKSGLFEKTVENNIFYHHKVLDQEIGDEY